MSYQLPLFDGPASKAGRDIGLATVADNAGEFIPDGIAAISHLRGEFTGEDIRRELLSRGIEPHHPNAWGALIRTAVVRGLLRETGRYVKMRDVSSHARRTAVYRRES